MLCDVLTVLCCKGILHYTLDLLLVKFKFKYRYNVCKKYNKFKQYEDICPHVINFDGCEISHTQYRMKLDANYIKYKWHQGGYY